MKSQLFNEAIYNRFSIRFLYNTTEVLIDPYFITEVKGRKYIYGRLYNSNEIKKFEYNRISNIRVFKNRHFSPRIPIINSIN